jgi:hypothetical protein
MISQCVLPPRGAAHGILDYAKLNTNLCPSVSSHCIVFNFRFEEVPVQAIKSFRNGSVRILSGIVAATSNPFEVPIQL